MAVEPFPRKLRIGHGDHLEQMVLRPGELLLGFTDDLDPERIDQLLAPHELADAEAPLHVVRRARLRSMRWVAVPGGDSDRELAQQFLRDVPECWLASPVYVPGSNPLVEDASVPLPGVLIVELTSPGDLGAIRDVEALGFRWHEGETPGDPDDPIAYFAVRDDIPDRGFDLLERVTQSPGVASVQFDWLKIDPLEVIPTGSLWPKQWNLERIGMPAAWDVSEGSEEILIAVIDTGIDLGHPALKGAISAPGTHASFKAGKDDSAFIRTGDAQAPMKPTPAGHRTTDDWRWHGTAVAGIIAASLRGAVLAGMAPGCKILPIRLEDVTFVTMREGLKWARQQGARVANFSISASGPDLGLETDFTNAVNDKDGLVICAASGNCSTDYQNAPVVYPAAYASVIAVGAATQKDEPKALDDGTEQWYSRGGANLDVLAPGIRIPTIDARKECGYNRGGAGRSITWFDTTTYKGDDAGPSGGNYQAVFTGTSAAVAHVSALAGLLFSKFPDRSSARVRAVIERSCAKVGGREAYPYADENGTKSVTRGYGRINAKAALNRAR